jgi:hypothetical protein
LWIADEKVPSFAHISEEVFRLFTDEAVGERCDGGTDDVVTTTRRTVSNRVEIESRRRAYPMVKVIPWPT